MKRHPVLLGLLIVVVLIAGFIALVLLFSRTGREKAAFALGEKIGVVEIRGTIISSKKIIDQLVTYREDGGVKAIILRVDSPGGGVGPSQEIYQEVLRTRKQKTVVASLGSVAASGGYYVACGADAIVANPGTFTGSIGVIMQFSNIEGLMKWAGIRTYTFKSGKHKDLGSPFREPTPEDEEIVMGVIESVYKQFIEAVAEGRNMEVDTVRNLADGRVFSGRQAMEYGLVDQMGNLQDAIALAAQMSGIRGRPNVIYPKRRRNLVEFLFDTAVTKLIEGMRTSNLQLYYKIPSASSF